MQGDIVFVLTATNWKTVLVEVKGIFFYGFHSSPNHLLNEYLLGSCCVPCMLKIK